MNENGDLTLEEIINQMSPNEPARKEYEELVEDSNILRALYAGGVSDWEWYDASLEDHLGGD